MNRYIGCGHWTWRTLCCLLTLGSALFADLTFAAHPCDVHQAAQQKKACVQQYEENQRRAEAQARAQAQQKEQERQRQLQLESKRRADQEAQRRAEQQRQAQMEAQRRAEQQRLAQVEAQRKAEQQRQAQAEAQQKAEKLRLAQMEAQRKVEQQRQAQAEVQRKADQQKQAQQIAQQQATERQQQAQIEEQKRIDARRQLEVERQRQAQIEAGKKPVSPVATNGGIQGPARQQTPAAQTLTQSNSQMQADVTQGNQQKRDPEKTAQTKADIQKQALINEEVARRMALQSKAANTSNTPIPIPGFSKADSTTTAGSTPMTMSGVGSTIQTKTVPAKQPTAQEQQAEEARRQAYIKEQKNYQTTNARGGMCSAQNQVYRCKRALFAPTTNQSRTGPDVEKNPAYHEYICVRTASGYVCGSQTNSSLLGLAGGPGAQDKKSIYDGDLCAPVSQDNCVSNCAVSAVSSTERPKYNVLGVDGGTNCQQWSEGVINKCIASCKKI